MENGSNFDAIYLDFQKAFDKADIGLILHRCREKGITGNLGIWILDYLSDRKQAVIANDEISDICKVISGVPQGSILGPLLFLILIDNIDDKVRKSSTSIFADDTKATAEINSIEEAITLQEDLEILYEWSEENNMVFNGLKFECIKYGTNELLKTQYDYIDPTNSNSIMDKPVIRDLGIQMDLSGQFETHIHSFFYKNQ